jgi:hypothetical protein
MENPRSVARFLSATEITAVIRELLGDDLAMMILS